MKPVVNVITLLNADRERERDTQSLKKHLLNTHSRQVADRPCWQDSFGRYFYEGQPECIDKQGNRLAWNVITRQYEAMCLQTKANWQPPDRNCWTGCRGRHHPAWIDERGNTMVWNAVAKRYTIEMHLLPVEEVEL